ncbi:MAG: hypothetical protein GY822_07045 [Deltaproteobacteria bacterium]|nr:hypothetical protein [Deltaproteobacteria bacterium]
MLTHHAPLSAVCDPAFATTPLAPAFASELPSLVGADVVTNWFFGHTHFVFGGEILGTRILSNPRGYPGDALGFDAHLVVEL